MAPRSAALGLVDQDGKWARARASVVLWSADGPHLNPDMSLIIKVCRKNHSEILVLGLRQLATSPKQFGRLRRRTSVVIYFTTDQRAVKNERQCHLVDADTLKSKLVRKSRSHPRQSHREGTPKREVLTISSSRLYFQPARPYEQAQHRSPCLQCKSRGPQGSGYSAPHVQTSNTFSKRRIPRRPPWIVPT